MPVIHTHVSVPTTPEQREALKAAYGKAITAVPGKSEGWLMCPFEDNMPIYLFLVKSVFRVSSLIFFGFRHEECRPVVCFTGCPSCRT